MVFFSWVAPTVFPVWLVWRRRSLPKNVFSSRDSEISWPRLLYVRQTMLPKKVFSCTVLNVLCLNNSRQSGHFLGNSQPLCLHLICVPTGIVKPFPQWTQMTSFGAFELLQFLQNLGGESQSRLAFIDPPQPLHVVSYHLDARFSLQDLHIENY